MIVFRMKYVGIFFLPTVSELFLLHCPKSRPKNIGLLHLLQA